MHQKQLAKHYSKSSSITTQKIYYSDFSVNLDAHPDNKQLIKKVNENAVIRSLKNLILTNKYERPFNPGLGSNISKLLFEPMTQATTIGIKSVIEETINNYEPRVNLLDVIVSPIEHQNAYVIQITFFLSAIQETINFTLQLSRVR